MSNLLMEIVIRARDEASHVIKEVAAETGGLSSTIGKLVGDLGLAGAAISGIATAGAAVVGIGAKFAEMSLQLDKVSKNTGVSTEHIQVLRETLKSFGVEEDAANTALFFLNKNIAAGNPLLREFGVTSHDTWTAFTQLSARLADVSPSERAAVSAKLLGRSAKELQGSLSELNPRLKEMAEQMGAAGDIIGGDTVKKGVLLEHQMHALNIEWQGMVKTMETAFLPAASKIVGALGGIANAARTATDAFKTLHEAQQQQAQAAADNVLKFFGYQEKPNTNPPNQLPMGAHGQVGDWNYQPPPPANPVAQTDLQRMLAELKNIGGLSYNFSAADANQHTRGKSPKEMLDDLAKGLKAVEEPTLRLTDSGQKAADKLAAMDTAMHRVGDSIAGAISGALSAVISGSKSIAGAFQSLMVSILQSIAQSAAQYGIGLGLDALSFLPGIGPALGIAGKGLMGIHGASRSGNVYINAIDTQSFVDASARPSGSVRRAQMRLAEAASFSGA